MSGSVNLNDPTTAGIIFGVMILLFLIWMTVRIVIAWRWEDARDRRELDAREHPNREHWGP